MAATVTVRVFTGAGAGTMSDPVSGIDLISASNALNSGANRVTNPVGIGTYSYEKWIKLRIDVAPVTNLYNILVWGDGVIQPQTKLFYGFTEVGAAPVNTPSTIAVNDFSELTAGNPASWDKGPFTAIGVIDTFLVLQLYADYYDLLKGAWTQEEISYSYEET